MGLFNKLMFFGRPPINGEHSGNGHSKKPYEVTQLLLVQATDPVNAARKAQQMVQSGELEAMTYSVHQPGDEDGVVIDLATEPPTIA